MILSKRLLAVASAVTPGNRVADIGTDHGYVPIYLVENGSIPSAIAMDVNRGPLERAVRHIREQGLESRISTRLSDGMTELKSHEADTVILAGMGGDLICRILWKRKDLLDEHPELVLQPQSEWFKVRHTLHDLGYRIMQEWFLKDEGKYYVIMKAIPGQERYDREADYIYGAVLEVECLPVYKEYLLREEKKRQGIMNRILENVKEDPSSQSKRLDELTEELGMIREKIGSLDI
ncbi:MAG: SAM-dependent methyltransferase [Eubacterium sp.]|nr:SAM-dependent methyltransferase [Eubacterium sp.]